MKFSIPADAQFFPSHAIKTGRRVEIGCGACFSHDGVMTDFECDGTRYNNSVTVELGEAMTVAENPKHKETYLTTDEIG